MNDVFLAQLGSKIKTIRRARKMSRRQVAEISSVSQRFLSQFEAGKGNISVARLRSLCAAIDVPMASVLDESPPASRLQQISSALTLASPLQLESIADILELGDPPPPSRRRIALIGLRGAGKSALASRLAQDLQYEVHHLDNCIEKLAGSSPSELISLQGQQAYRKLELEALIELIGSDDKIVIVTGGNLVCEHATYRYLLSHFWTVWVAATAEEHLRRLVARGEQQVPAGEDDTLHRLETILQQREQLHARAHFSIDTSARSIEECAGELLQAVSECD